MSAPALSGVPRHARQIKKSTVRHPGLSAAARAPPSTASSRHRKSALSPTRTSRRTFQFQEIKHT
jgi:hypothetical protein